MYVCLCERENIETKKRRWMIIEIDKRDIKRRYIEKIEIYKRETDKRREIVCVCVFMK